MSQKAHDRTRCVSPLFACHLPALQVERWAQKPEEKMGWVIGDAWGHRRTGYRKIAHILGGKYLKAYNDVYAREPEHTRHIVRDVTPEVKHQSAAVKVA